MQPVVSIIIPVYNTAAYLSQCLDSCLRQSIVLLEILCIDDASSDDSLVILRAYEAKDSRVKVFSREHHGAAVARNFALMKAQGHYIAFMDSDDYYPNDHALSLLVQAAKEHSVAIAGGSMCMDRAGEIDFDSLHGRELDSFEKEGLVDYRDYQYNYDYTRYIYDRNMLFSKDIKFPQYALYEDPPFFVHSMMAAGNFYAIPEAVYCYRHSTHDAREWTAKQASDRLRGIMECLKISLKKKYAILHRHLAIQLKYEAPQGYAKNSEDKELLSLLCKATAMIDVELIKTIDPDFDDFFIPDSLSHLASVYRELNTAHEEIESILKSSTYRTGRILLKIPCSIKDLLVRWNHSRHKL